MTVTAHIDISTLKVRKIICEFAKNENIVVFDNPLPLGDDGLLLLNYSSEEVENMVWDKLSDHYRVDIR